MADESTITWADLMREAKGPLVEALRFKTVLLSEVKRDKNPRRWNGKQITIPIFVSLQQGTSTIGQTQILPSPQVVDTEQAVIQSAIVACAVSFSTQVLNQAKGDENVWAEVLPTKMERTEDSFGRVINEMMTGLGDALLAPVAAGTAASGGANTTQTINVGNTGNFYQLYVGRIVDVLVRSTGLRVAGLASAVKITGVDFANFTVTVVRMDGVTGGFATATTDGIYNLIESYNPTIASPGPPPVASGTAQLQGLRQAAAASGTFEGIDKGAIDAWRGTQATPTGTPPANGFAPTIAVFDRAERLTAQRSGRTPDFYLVDPAVIDKFSQALTVQAQWAGAEGNLETGWTGVRYRNKLLVPDFDMAPGVAIGVQKSDMAIYTLDDGPDWDEHTGSMFQRFGNRSLPLEAWLIWMLQFGFEACNGIANITTLERAA